MIAYIASPYSHPDPIRRELNFLGVMRFTAWWLKQGHFGYSPIVHSHEMAQKNELPYEFEWWQAYNEAMIRALGSVVALCLDGWKESRGIASELALCEREGIPVEYFIVTEGGEYVSNGPHRPG